MAEAPAGAVAEKAGRAPKKKKSRPTNCAQSNKRIRRKDWYYRDGKYFANKKNYQLFKQAEAEKAKKAEAEKAAKAAETKAAEAKAAAEAPKAEPPAA